MNWYKSLQSLQNIIKQSQIWHIPIDEYDGGFIPYLKRLYELEFKYSFVKTSNVFVNPGSQEIKFQGMPKRRENILKGLENEIKKTMPFVVEPMLITFEKWLDKHAILNPKQWAIARVVDVAETDRDFLFSLWGEYRYLLKYNTNFTTFLSETAKHINETAGIKRLYEYLKDINKETAESNLAKQLKDLSNDTSNVERWKKELIDVGVKMAMRRGEKR